MRTYSKTTNNVPHKLSDVSDNEQTAGRYCEINPDGVMLTYYVVT